MERNILYLSNVEIFEYCEFNRLTKERIFFKQSSSNKVMGLYFKQNEIFFALYWNENQPTIFYEGEEFILHKNLNIQLRKRGSKRKFKIVNYGVDISYTKCPYIGFDSWSDEIDVDLFCKIVESYSTDEFYKNKPQKDFKFPWTAEE